MQIANAPKLYPIVAGGEGKACQPAVAGLPNVGERVMVTTLIKG